MVKVIRARREALRSLGLMFMFAGLFGMLAMISVCHLGAATIAAQNSGIAATVSGLDNLAGTIQAYASGNVGMAIATVMTLGGMGMALAGKASSGAAVAGAGIATAFVPSMIGGVYMSTGLSLVPLFVQGGGDPHVVVQGLLVLLFVPVTAARTLMDPVMLGLVLLTLAAVPEVRRQVRQSVASWMRLVRVRLAGAAVAA